MAVDKNEFVQKVLSIKNELNKKGLKLKHLFKQDLECETTELEEKMALLNELRVNLAESPDIISYLSRPASEIDFIEQHPHLIDVPKGASRAKKENTDYYELKFSKALNFGYRNKADTNEFFKQFRPNRYTDFLIPLLQNSVTEHCHVHPYDEDIYRVRSIIDQYMVDKIAINTGLKFS
ncbi:MAG: hypothetical protein RLZ35_1147 [Pseudomonadota bacterium]|jgi:hypothetical protein